MQDDANAMGIRVIPRRKEPDCIEVPQCHWIVWELFCACSTQWNAGMAGYTGMIYSEVRQTARDDFGIREPTRRRRTRARRRTATRRPTLPSVMARIRIIEQAALDAWAEKRKQEAG